MRVAVVDPSRTVAKFLTRLLESNNHEVVSFIDGAEALDYIKSNQFVDVLITSAQLLSMSGPELCGQTRLLGATGRPLYIVLMSSTDDPGNLIKALDSGADDFIRKPPVPEELVARLAMRRRAVMSVTGFRARFVGKRQRVITMKSVPLGSVSSPRSWSDTTSEEPGTINSETRSITSCGI
jgi:DNA-binding response OmpR family regulator